MHFFLWRRPDGVPSMQLLSRPMRALLAGVLLMPALLAQTPGTTGRKALQSFMGMRMVPLIRS